MSTSLLITGQEESAIPVQEEAVVKRPRARFMKVAAYCSHGNRYERFSSDSEMIETDVDLLLSIYGASEEIRTKVQSLLQSPETHFPAGFRYESTGETRDPERTVVYATMYVPMIDGGLKSLAEKGITDAVLPDPSPPEEV